MRHFPSLKYSPLDLFFSGISCKGSQYSCQIKTPTKPLVALTILIRKGFRTKYLKTTTEHINIHSIPQHSIAQHSITKQHNTEIRFIKPHKNFPYNHVLRSYDHHIVAPLLQLFSECAYYMFSKFHIICLSECSDRSFFKITWIHYNSIFNY